MRNRWAQALVAAAAVAALVPLPRPVVERFYSTGAYVAVQPSITSLSNLVPFALFDLLLLTVIGAWLARTALDVVRIARIGVILVLGRLLSRTLLFASSLYLGFVLVWGLNYRRVPLEDKLQFDPHVATLDRAREVASAAADRVNILHDEVRPGDWGEAGAIDADLAAAFERAQRDLGATLVAVPARPKHTLLDLYFRRASIDGLTDPYFLETLVAIDLLPFERPFVMAHEWAHLAGFAAEGDANFVGWVTCLRAGRPSQYSGWLFLYGQIAGGLPRADRAAAAARLARGPREDLRAIAARVARDVSPRVADAGRRVYDRYLKANRVEAGTASYGEVVKLVLGTKFGPNWTPLVGRVSRPR